MPRGFIVQGIAPTDLRRYPDSAHLMYWSWVASLGLIAKSRDLEAGIQASGAPMRPISKETRKHRKSEMTPTGLGDPGGAPLSPGHELSRVQSLLAAEAHVDHAPG